MVDTHLQVRIQPNDGGRNERQGQKMTEWKPEPKLAEN